MNIAKFKRLIDYQEPLICLQGDIFETPADHIVFAVNYPDSRGGFNNNTGFAGKICETLWPGLRHIAFKKGEVRSKRWMGKTYYAMAIHTNEPNGWAEAPELILECLNQKISVSSTEVIATVLIGGGESGKKWKASLDNIVSMSRTHKTVVLYIKEPNYYQLLIQSGVATSSIPLDLFPKTKKVRALESA